MTNTTLRRDLRPNNDTPVFARALVEHQKKMAEAAKAREETRQSLFSRYGFSF